MNAYIEMGLASLIPLTVSVILHFVFKGSKIKYATKQIIVGVVFGGIAILGTEFGVPLNGAVMNARDAAPLCAGLIFGAPAGIIAGIIGGVERWFCVYWGGGTYTRLACSLATVISGLFGALLKKYMFNNKIPKWPYALAVGIVAETMHMTMVYITNSNDISKAFLVVKTCTAPMITINALAVMLAVLAINYLDKEELYEIKGVKPTLAQQFQKSTLAIVLIAFVTTSLFTLNIQNIISQRDTKNLLTTNIQDVENSIKKTSDTTLLVKMRKVKNEISKTLKVDEEYLTYLMEKYDIDEINIVDSTGIITASTNEAYVGYDMNSGEQSKVFMSLIYGADQEMVQEYMPNSADGVGHKYAGIIYKGGFIQIALLGDSFFEQIAETISLEANSRHVGQNGGLIIVDSKGLVVSDLNDNIGLNAKLLGVNIKDEHEEFEVFETTVDGTDCYAAQAESEGYTIFAYYPVEEAHFSRDCSIYLNIFMEIIVFAGIFILLYFLIESNVVSNVKKVNKSLEKITNGDLDVVVDQNDSQEFTSLSNGINTTVDAMKKLIAEASARIDSELQYAQDIQASSLPTYFEENDRYDLFASMNPAKEVGGDFYDFYKLDDKTLVIVVADVSGKGIPAALFMMRAKSTLKTYAEAGIAVADIFTNANYELTQGNNAGLFVTAWMAFINLETGEVKYANAGHNPPVVRHKNGEFEYLVSKVGLVLGGMEGIVYKEQIFDLKEGDELFLYTDGVTEATDINNKLFGEERLKKSLNSHIGTSSENLCHLVRKDVDEFVGEAPQFDDMTMLSLKIKEAKK